eukprot:Phypoly_transcript_07660.p1 GENE.Phypoly_transcript_07660~~Phypoly_transcript_07660.p1  ORF type:complete len:368 (+),score=59.94 Phypoly_transcript_07660:469-1572(+)
MSNSQETTQPENKKQKMSVPEQFTGLAGFSKEHPHDLKEYKYKPKTWTEDDIDIKITCCGICGSDLHTLRSGWGHTSYPAIVGHEIVGTAVRVGQNVKHVKVGDRVGVGAQCGSCHSCNLCNASKEQYCGRSVHTYNSKWHDGTQTQGGYADYTRVDGAFVFKVPDNITDAEAAPLFCAGVTVFSPLRRNNVGPGKKVGVVGVGGLGHLGIQFAAALGAEVTAISRNKSKEEDAKKLGATRYMATEDPEEFKKNQLYFDVIICTSYQNHMDLNLYTTLLATEGTFVILGAPETPFAPLQGFPLLMKGRSIQGSLIGSPAVINEMLELASKHNVKSWIETRPLSQAKQTLDDMQAGKARFRYVLLSGQ